MPFFLAPLCAAMAAQPLVALGVGLSAVGAAQQASAQKKQAQYQSQVEQNNAIIAEQNAMDSIRRGAVESAKHGVRIRQTYGSAKAAAAGSGMDVTVQGEVAAKLLRDITTAGAYDMATIRHNASMEARRAMIQKDQFTAQSRLFDLQASSISPMMAGLSAGLGAAVQSDLI